MSSSRDLLKNVCHIPMTERTKNEGIREFLMLQENLCDIFLSQGKLAQMVKNPPAMQEIQVQSLGWDNLLEEGMATHSSILAWRIPMDRGAWWARVHGVTENQTRLSD